MDISISIPIATPMPIPTLGVRYIASIFETASHVPGAHLVTHATTAFRAANVAERILSSWLIAIRSLPVAALNIAILRTVLVPHFGTCSHENRRPSQIPAPTPDPQPLFSKRPLFTRKVYGSSACALARSGSPGLMCR